ncbi:FAD-binding oxidoreductase [Rhodococcus sp. AG1013]|uniref:FAD-binding oxidoreductase n=1 Tax=unclassified Rhodococcus (in: high G+C Gram-positive bacteria) TaxID=192944 RepID=UPI000E0A884D|nr:FAD-binding oxidoreductase [Rhodococcus sp. AG1013]RDI26862.1 NAD(P)H-flavin reductase [Rhodococcus sp. AG1013]
MEPAEISLIRAQFAAVTSSTDTRDRFAHTFYTQFFGRIPQSRSLFPAGMDGQRVKLVAAVEFIVRGLDDTDRLLPFLAQLGRDHRKYGVQREHYAAAGNALLDAMRDADSDGPWGPHSDAAWRELIALITTTMSDAADADDFPALWEATVVSHERVLRDLAIIRLESDSPIPYSAGQYLSVQIPQRPQMWRYLSPAMPTNPFGQLEFHVRRVSGGWVSPAMVNETAVGDRWQLSSPLGGLHVDRESGQDVLMIAGGTGLAPLRAQIMDMAHRGINPRVHLFVGGTYPCDLYDIETLWHLSLSNPWLTVVPVTEEDENPWWHPYPSPEPPPGMHQRLLGPLGRVVGQFGTWADRQVQICGSPAMVKTTAYALQRTGTPASSISHDPLR